MEVRILADDRLDRGHEMLQFGATARRGSMYFLGTATGLALAIPLAAAAFTAHPATREAPLVPIAAPGAVMQSQFVNRTGKGSRLEVRLPSAPVEESSSVVVKAPSTATLRTAAAQENASGKSSNATPAARAMPSLKGCLSSIGVTKSNLTTEELTVCVADASIINSIN